MREQSCANCIYEYTCDWSPAKDDECCRDWTETPEVRIYPRVKDLIGLYDDIILINPCSDGPVADYIIENGTLINCDSTPEFDTSLSLNDKVIIMNEIISTINTRTVFVIKLKR